MVGRYAEGMKTMMITMVLVLTLTACGRGLETRGIAVQNASPEDEATVRAALADLGGLVDRPVTAHAEDVGPHLGKAPVGTEDCVIRFRPGQGAAILKTVIWHEYGHCVGLTHVEDDYEIMYPKAEPFEEYTRDEVESYLTAVAGAIK